MSTITRDPDGGQDVGLVDETVRAVRSTGTFRWLALLGVIVLSSTTVWKLYEIDRGVNGTGLVLPAVLLAVVVAVIAARTIDERTAALVAIVLATLGYGTYLLVVDAGLSLLVSRFHQVVADIVALFTGMSATRISRVDIWALGFAPPPVFLGLYLSLRRRYLAGTTVGGLALLVMVLTGDAGAGLTLVGVLSGIAAVGFGELDRRGGTLLQADVLVVLVTLMALLSLAVPLIPASAADPLRLGNLGGPDTVEGTFVGSPGEMSITGSIELSPTVRYTVEAGERRYWRTGAYDRFLGDKWVRTGQADPYQGQLEQPPGPRNQVVQTYTAESQVETMPAAAEPVEVIGEATRNTQVTTLNTLRPENTFIENDTYRIRSLVPNATPAELRNASTDYSEAIRQQYVEELPRSTSDELRERTEEITEDAENPYEAASAVESYLKRTKNYSLEVNKPSGNIANEFLLEMDAGYCTYFATTMAVMLRTEGIPARVAVGYTPGQQVSENEYLVRGLNSHVWVEVYFPEYGWVQFDPTPAGPRESVETERIQEARQGDGSGEGASGSGDGGAVDAGGSAEIPLGTTSPSGATNGTANGTAAGPGSITIPQGTGTGGSGSNATVVPGTPDGGGGFPLPPLPSGRDAAVGTVVLLGLAAGAHRVGVADRVYRGARLRWQGASDTPVEDVRRAYERLEMILEREYRGRDPGETHREYIEALSERGLDERARRVAELHERARYAGRIDRETADEAIDLVDRMVRERTPVVGRIRRRLA